MSLSTAALSSYVPFRTRRALADLAGPQTEPTTSHTRGAILFADISGFTALTEQLSARGDGAEVLSDVLERFLGRLVRELCARGGDVIKFAGDALMVLFDGAPDDRSCALRAVAAALCAQRILRDYQTVEGTRLNAWPPGRTAGSSICSTSCTGS